MGTILLVFLRLGLTSFGGPIAHLGYFRAEFFERRRWLSDLAFADLVALCQFLPGPASSQVGFGIGLLRAGIVGGIAAWAAFTLPSAIVMLLFAYGVGDAATSPLGAGLLHGLKLVAVAIVAQAVLGMARTLCPDRARAAIAAFAVVLLVIVPGSAGQIGAIFAGGTVALLAISLPGLLALVGAAPFWNGLRSDPAAQAVMRGVNAAVVGLLAASLYDPVWVSAVQSPADFAVVVVGFVLLVAWRAPPLLVVLLSAAAGIGLAMAQPHRF